MPCAKREGSCPSSDDAQAQPCAGFRFLVIAHGVTMVKRYDLCREVLCLWFLSVLSRCRCVEAYQVALGLGRLRSFHPNGVYFQPCRLLWRALFCRLLVSCATKQNLLCKERKDPTWCRRNFVNGRSVARAVDVRQQLAKILRERLRVDPEVCM